MEKINRLLFLRAIIHIGFIIYAFVLWQIKLENNKILLNYYCIVIISKIHITNRKYDMNYLNKRGYNVKIRSQLLCCIKRLVLEFEN